MNKKVVAIFMTLVITMSTFVIYSSDLEVEASGGGGSVDFDYDLIHYFADKLSDIIEDYPTVTYPGYELAKGRAFGSDGERQAAISIYNWMLGEEYCDLDYVESLDDNKIEDLWYPLKYRYYPLNSKLTIISRNMTIHGKEEEDPIVLGESDFYISPQWNQSLIPVMPFNKDKLTQHFEYTGLKVIRYPYNTSDFFDFVEDRFDCYLITAIINILKNPSESLAYLLINEIEDYYNLTFDGLDPNDNTTWFPFYEPVCCANDYVFIQEDPHFNPNVRTEAFVDSIRNSILPPNIQNATIKIFKAIKKACYWRLDSHCKGIIRFDFNDYTYDMNYHINKPLPFLYINRTLGNYINDSVDDFTIDFDLNQEWNNSVISSNVIGKITGTDNDKYVIVSCLYDSWWCQGVADSAIGMGMVLSIAKYMKELKEYGVTPKYSIKFIGFSGEEEYLRGAKYYQRQHKTDDIVAIIDLNQLGFDQPDSSSEDLTLEIQTNKKQTALANIINLSGYPYENDIISLGKREAGDPGNYVPFAQWERLWKIPTSIFIVKNGKWAYHHRDGKTDGTGDPHEEGDTMTYYNYSDVNATANFTLDIVKYFTIDPDCWFEDGYPSYEVFDNDSNGIYDTINVSYKIKSIPPTFILKVNALLQSRHVAVDSGTTPSILEKTILGIS